MQSTLEKKKKGSLSTGGLPHHATLSYRYCPCVPPRRAWLLHDGALPHGSWRQPKELPLVFPSPSGSKAYLLISNPWAVLQQPVVSVVSTALTPRNLCCPEEASWHRANCVKQWVSLSTGWLWRLMLLNVLITSESVHLGKTKSRKSYDADNTLHNSYSSCGFFWRSCRSDGAVMVINGVLSP